jgi:hypothetical protein
MTCVSLYRPHWLTHLPGAGGTSPSATPACSHAASMGARSRRTRSAVAASNASRVSVTVATSLPGGSSALTFTWRNTSVMFSQANE